MSKSSVLFAAVALVVTVASSPVAALPLAMGPQPSQAPSCAYCDDYTGTEAAVPVASAWQPGVGYSEPSKLSAQACAYCEDYTETPPAVVASTWQPPGSDQLVAPKVRWAMAGWRFW